MPNHTTKARPMLRAVDLRRPDVELPPDVPLPAPGACWAGTAARLQAEAGCMDVPLMPARDRVHVQLPPDVPMPSVASQLAAARSTGLADGMRIGALRRSYWDMFVGAVWGAVLGMLFTLGGSLLGLLALPGNTAAPPAPAPAGPIAPAERGGSALALAMLAAAVPLRRAQAAGATARPATWWTAAPHRACEVCAEGRASPTGRVCVHPQVTRYSGRSPVPVPEARAREGACGTDARHHTLG